MYRAGSGPAVIVISEMPGITPESPPSPGGWSTIGCTATLPVLFGEPGPGGSARLRAPLDRRRLRVARVLDHRAAPDLAGHDVAPGAGAATSTSGAAGPGVGVVGMCFTGGFALGMMVDDTVLAPVLSQPSLPFRLSKKRKADIGISDADLARVKERTADGRRRARACASRATGSCPAERFETLRRELGDRFIGVEIDSSEGNPHGIPKAAHSVLTEHLVDEPGHPTHDALAAGPRPLQDAGCCA